MLVALKSYFENLWPGKPAQATKTLKQDHRRAMRTRQRMRDGFISYPTRPAFPPQPCRIIDLSISGARIELNGDEATADLYRSGLLLYFMTERHEIACSVAWQKGRMMGLHFESKPQRPSREYR